MNGGMKKGDVSREMRRISIVLHGWMRFFFFFSVIRLAGALFDERLGEEIRESTVTNSFAKHASQSGHFARKFNMPGRARSIKPRCPSSRVPA